MNKINIDINFTEGTLEPNGIDLITGDYNSTEIDFSFDEAHQENRKVFEMKSPSNEVVMLEEIRDNKIGLYGLVDVTTTHDDKTYIKYTKNDTIYWYNKEDNKLYDDEWNEIVTFDLTEYTKVQKKSSLFQEEGYYIFEISCYGTDSKLTSVSGRLPVVKEQVPISDEIVEPYLPIFDQLIQDVDSKIEEVDTKIEEVDTKLETIDGKLEDIDTAITQTNNLNIDVSDKVNKDVTITLTKKDNTTKSVVISDGKSLQFVWQGTSLGIKTDDMQDYVFVDLQGRQGVPGPQGEPFRIKKTYPSVQAMNNDFNNMNYGDYVMIASSVEVQDNAKLYTRGETQWIFITDFSGATGIKGETGATPNIQIGNVTSGDTPSVTRTGTDENPVLNFVLKTGPQGIQGNPGPTGNGIASITKTSTSGLTDTYTITYTNGTSTTYEVSNGKGIVSIEKTATSGSVDTYTITFNDGTTTTYDVTNGEVTQEQLDEVIEENTYLNNVINQLPRVNGTGNTITLDNTIEAKMKCNLSPSEMTQETTTGKNKLNYTNVKTINTGGNWSGDTYTWNDITFTLQKDGGIKVNGTASAATYLNLNNSLSLESGSEYILNGCPSGGGVQGYSLRLYTGSSYESETGNSKTFTYGSQDSVRINIFNGTQVNNQVFYPMIRLSSVSDATYEKFTYGASPNPQYPQDIHTTTGDNSINVCGENLFDEDSVTFTIGILDDNGEPTGSTTSQYTNQFYNVIPNQVYTINGTVAVTGVNYRIYFYDINKQWLSRTPQKGANDHTFTTPNNCYYIRIQVSTTITLKTHDVMLYKGNETLPYEPYSGNTYPLTLETLEYSKIGNYEDEFIYNTTDTNLELGKWYLKKNTKKFILNGSEAWTGYTDLGTNARAYFTTPDLVMRSSGYSDRFNVITLDHWGTDETSITITPISASLVAIKLPKNLLSTQDSAGIKAWLNTNNTIVYCCLTTPTYTLLNDTLQTQLTNIYNNMMSKKTQTNISQVNDDLPMVISASALLDLNTLVGG